MSQYPDHAAEGESHVVLGFGFRCDSVDLSILPLLEPA